MFHKHKFEEQRRVFTPPNTRGVTLKGRASDHIMDFAYGFTSIELKYTECDNIKFVKQNGNQT